MAVASSASGTQAATLDTEHTLATKTTPGVYVLVVDTSNMVNGDIVIFRIKTKNQSGKSSILAYLATYANAQSDDQKYRIPVPVDTEIACTLQQTDGTGRNSDWN